MGRPIWVGESRDGVFFASTKLALEIVERYCELRLRKREVREGTLLTLEDGRIVGRERFRPDLDYVEDHPLPAVRAPQERDFCLTALAALAAPPKPTVPVGADRDALLDEPLADQELERRPRAAARLEHPVDLPLGQHRLVARAAPPASRRTSAGGRAAVRARQPWAIARSSRSSPTATSKPASRSAVESEPNVCQ